MYCALRYDIYFNWNSVLFFLSCFGVGFVAQQRGGAASQQEGSKFKSRAIQGIFFAELACSPQVCMASLSQPKDLHLVVEYLAPPN